MKNVRIGGAALNQTPIDWQHNSNNIIFAINQAKEIGIKILCLPELSITAYGCQDLFLSPWVTTKALKILMNLVYACDDIAVAIGLPYRIDDKVYNSTCLVQNKKILGFYSKQILANDGIHYEPRWFNPWKPETQTTVEIDGLTYPFGDITFDLYGLKVGLEICEDAWNQERPACRLFKRGIELILNPSASHFSFYKGKTREDLVVNSSKSFECGYLYVNQLGNESGRVIYDGDVIIAQNGSLLTKNTRFSFQPLDITCIDFNVEGTYNSEYNKKEKYTSRCEEFRQAGALGLFDYLRKSGARGYALSLSGGADSSSIAVLVYEMVRLGIEQLDVRSFCAALNLKDYSGSDDPIRSIVKCIFSTAYQGTINSSHETLESAKNLAESLGAEFTNWTIDEIVESNTSIIEQAIGRKMTWETNDIALQNIQARVRSPLIWMIANIKGFILLTTSNRSEGDVGYTTMDGDTSGSLAPIAGVDKPFILEWLQYAQNDLGHDALSYVNNLTPSAELRPSEMTQSDEDDLMPYSLMKKIEYLSIFQRKSPIETFEILKREENINKESLKEYLQKFFKLWSANQWKRERIAPSFHIDEFNVDPKTWCRFPILSGSFKAELEELASM